MKLLRASKPDVSCQTCCYESKRTCSTHRTLYMCIYIKEEGGARRRRSVMVMVTSSRMVWYGIGDMWIVRIIWLVRFRGTWGERPRGRQLCTRNEPWLHRDVWDFAPSFLTLTFPQVNFHLRARVALHHFPHLILLLSLSFLRLLPM